MSGRTPEISVVIRSYTEARWESLAAALGSLAAQTLTPHEIVLVIDHNLPLEERARRELRGVTVVANSLERGSSGAWNSGIAAASGSIVAFIDDDALALPDWLERLAAPYDDPAVVGVGGAIAPHWQAGRPPWFPREFDWVVGCTYAGLPERPAPVRNLIGCNMSFRREVFAALGGFRAGIGHVGGKPFGGDETEFCIRLHQRWPRAVLLYEPGARVGHQVPASRSRWAYFRERCYLEGRSKARVAEFVGAGDGLASERAYTLRTLPAGVLGGMLGAASGRDPAGLRRAAAIVAGLTLASAGYLQGRLAVRAAALRRGARPATMSEVTL
jgi:GT2 family glycosyltransferase